MKQVTALAISILFVCFGCKKQSSDAEAAKAALRSNARPGSVSNTYTAKVDCNYVLNETALSDSGWIKMDSFTMVIRIPARRLATTSRCSEWSEDPSPLPR